MGGGLPAGIKYDGLVSGADLAPTALGAQDRNVPDEVDGIDLWNSSPSEKRVVRSDFWANAGRVQYGASSAWDENGGIVHHHGSAPERLLFAVHRKLYKGAQASANRRLSPRAVWRLAYTFGKGEIIYGSPRVDRVRAATVLSFEGGTDKRNAERISKDQLRALGYVE
jgi:hypothetical protein